MKETFENLLSGGHPNSLGRTVDVVECVVAQPNRFAELFDCYSSDDEVVRLRTSSAVKRVEARRHDLLLPYIDRLIDEIGDLDQASAQWTLAQLFERLAPDMTDVQFKSAKTLIKRNLKCHNDWIVLNCSIQTLSTWARTDSVLKRWLKPHLQRLANDTRKSVAKRARKQLEELNIE